MAAPLSDITPLIRDYTRNQNLTDVRLLRAINSASAFVFARYGIPGYEKVYSFDFFDEQALYDQPADMNDPLSLRFQDDELNQNARFSFRPGEFLFERVTSVTLITKNMDTRLWGPYWANGKFQIYAIARNSTSGLVIDSFDSSAALWTGSDDATNLANDPYTFKEGNGSLSFDVDVSLSGLNRATISSTSVPTGPLDMTSIATKAHARVWHYIPSVTNFTSVSFNWGSDASNYFKRTVTTQEDGTALAVGWNKLDFPWDSSVVQVGTPNLTAMNYYAFNDNYAAGYADASGFRYDYLRFVVPDPMYETYYTLYKGTDATGVTSKINFTATTDLFLFGGMADDVSQLIAMEAAALIDPTILVDNKEIKEAREIFHKMFARKYPRKRTNNMLADPKVAKTSTPY